MREIILKSLQQNEYISGEQLAKKLNISRTAVWKHINELRESGYKIDSSPRRGYILINRTPLLLPEEIKIGLCTSVMGKVIVHKYEVTSTQDVAEQLARDGAEEGTMVIAELQTQGRGRLGRNWVSPEEGGIYLSLILRPRLMPRQVTQIPLIAGVALSRAIEEMSRLQPQIKWPNDIILSGKKVAGILTEMSSEMDRIKYVILGVGINVNTRKSRLPKSIRETAACLADEYGERFSRVKLVQHFLSEFETLYTNFLISGFESIRKQWKSRNMTTGHRVKVVSGSEEISGEAVDIDSEGLLLVRNEAGITKVIMSGDVSVINSGK